MALPLECAPEKYAKNLCCCHQVWFIFLLRCYFSVRFIENEREPPPTQRIRNVASLKESLCCLAKLLWWHLRASPLLSFCFSVFVVEFLPSFLPLWYPRNWLSNTGARSGGYHTYIRKRELLLTISLCATFLFRVIQSARIPSEHMWDWFPEQPSKGLPFCPGFGGLPSPSQRFFSFVSGFGLGRDFPSISTCECNKFSWNRKF